ncbi:molybdenum cofactor guanylyltransferase MobA [Roseicella frigidaeris]|uniref:Molybdenum cofactor guanylyltransferase n=1 Tax=Roseicella frigidaeris TaxID=2230885 RepID=A0A327M630_9PROT|nr:molybdenum cofactor guanylyltransferase MobA [Roseicella frigidaeris]RAI57885.1 molybdenum cofactor guanylyltransferase MobA [Roseicella frigidaeris]
MRQAAPSPASAAPAILGVILAGGLARRMGGGDKPLRQLGGRPLLGHVLARLRPQVAAVILNANGEAARFADLALPVVADSLPGHPGPLAGVLAALDWAAAHRPDLPDLLSVPGDTPFLPADLATRLAAARRDAGLPIACAASAGRQHPPIALWPVGLRHALRDALQAGERRAGRIAAHLGCATATWPTTPCDPFFNANTPEDLARAEAMLPGLPA